MTMIPQGMEGIAFILVISFIALIYTYRKNEKKVELIAVIFGIILVVSMIGINKAAPGIIYPELGEWNQIYIDQSRASLQNYPQYTQNTYYYDYENGIVSEAAYEISQKSATPDEAIRYAAAYVYDNVHYIYGEGDSACLSRSAPAILSLGTGQCDTQSIALIAILRKMGIAARPVGGCIMKSNNCAMQSFLQSFNILKGPKYQEITDIPPIGTYGRAGGLHAWVEAYNGERWVTVEATAGKVADLTCWTYHVELYPENNQKDDICLSKNMNYVQACASDNLAGLNANGLGVVEI